MAEARATWRSIGPSTPASIHVSSLVLWRFLTWVIPVAAGAVSIGVRGAHHAPSEARLRRRGAKAFGAARTTCRRARLRCHVASKHRRWGVRRTSLWMGAALAAGCIPSGRLVTRVLTGKSLVDVGDGKPGSSNVARSVVEAGRRGARHGSGKAFAPAAAARLAGAGDGTVAALGITAMVGHIVAVKGRGAACALGAAFAMDPR